MKKYGVGCSLLANEVRKQISETMIKRYKVEYYAQTSEFHKIARKKYKHPKYPELSFGSSWEFKVYDFLTEHHIEFEYQPDTVFHYECDGKKHTYHPDFKVGNKIVEVKGDQFFRMNETTGKEEMFCPNRQRGITDEEYLAKCRTQEAKHQCMLANNVIILRGKHINEQELVNIFINEDNANEVHKQTN